jgi:hypothetical protein
MAYALYGQSKAVSPDPETKGHWGAGKLQAIDRIAHVEKCAKQAVL